TSTNAVVRWQTDVATGTKVRLSPAPSATSNTPEQPTTSHTATLSGLKPGVTYTVVVGTARVWLATNTFTTTATSEAPPASHTPAPSLIVKPTLTPTPSPVVQAPPTAKIWGNPESLPDHFKRHGRDFGAKNQDDYARMAWEFLQRARAESLPAKQDEEGVLRVFDPK